MSQARGNMLDQVIHYYFQNLSADTTASSDEESRLFYDQELRIEVSCFLKILLLFKS